MNYNYSSDISCLFFIIFFSMSMLIFILSLYFCVLDYVVFVDWNIITLNSCCVLMTVLIDFSALMFMSFVMYISSLVIYYGDSYMMGDENVVRFMMMVMLFVLSMMFLIISPNLISILLGWDGLGLVSYCLVIYYQNVKSYNAGMLTALSNRVGDVALLIAISWLFSYGGWNYLFMDKFDLKINSIGYVVMLVMLAALTKSAQIPFSAWLPAAMAAPTPVSALVHSSTLVTAGVYLLIRFGHMIKMYNMGEFLLIVGCLTMLMSGLGANFEYDLSKIIALSTLSQLGLMMGTIGLGYYDLAFFHLLVHAFFKALLFMCAGVIIHGLNNLQDIRGMGSVINQMPMTSICFCVSNLALCGLPFLSGFYSKDLILELSLMSNLNLLIFLMFFISTGLTVSYSFRVIYYVMLGMFNYNCFHGFGDENFGFIGPMLMMLLVAVIGGSVISWLILSSPHMICLPFWMKVFALGVSVMGGWLGMELSIMVMYSKLLIMNYYLISFLELMWFMPFMSTYFMSGGVLNSGFKLLCVMDFGWNEELGGQGLFKILKGMFNMNQVYQNNMFKIYLMSFITWFFLFLVMINFFN